MCEYTSFQRIQTYTRMDVNIIVRMQKLHLYHFICHEKVESRIIL